MKICLLNETKSFLFHFFFIFIFSSRKKGSISSFVYFGENKGIMLQTLRRKQKYQVTNVGIEKVELSHLLVQCIKVTVDLQRPNFAKKMFLCS